MLCSDEYTFGQGRRVFLLSFAAVGGMVVENREKLKGGSFCGVLALETGL